MRDTALKTAGRLEDYVSLNALNDWSNIAIGQRGKVHSIHIKSDLFKGGLEAMECIEFTTTLYKLSSQEIEALALSSEFVITSSADAQPAHEKVPRPRSGAAAIVLKHEEPASAPEVLLLEYWAHF